MATDLLADWRHLGTESARAKIIRLRDAVAPILANNLIAHFTDHTVTHSDSVCGLVDQLIAPLQRMRNALSDEELVILYAACYLHDIGMQYEAAYQTQAIQSLSLPRPWAELSVESRRDLLRRHHHLISAEMVSMSIRAERTPIGDSLHREVSGRVNTPRLHPWALINTGDACTTDIMDCSTATIRCRGTKRP